jgi:hypothetical protein
MQRFGISCFCIKKWDKGHKLGLLTGISPSEPGLRHLLAEYS